MNLVLFLVCTTLVVVFVLVQLFAISSVDMDQEKEMANKIFLS